MKPHIQSFRSLIQEMRDVASGHRKPAKRTSKLIFESEKSARSYVDAHERPDGTSLKAESVESVMRLLTPENQRLVKVIAGGHAGSVAELAEMTKRAESNVTRTLKKFESLGLIELADAPGRRKIPRLTVRSLSFRVEFATGEVVILKAAHGAHVAEPAMTVRPPVKRTVTRARR